MTLTTAEMRAAIVAQRQGPERCSCGGPLWTVDLILRLAASLERAFVAGVEGTTAVELPFEGCRVCDVCKDRSWTEAHNREYDRWRNKHAEANVPETRVTITWAEETFPHGHPPTFYADTFDDVTLAALERSHRPRAIVEVGPEPGSEAAALMLSDTRYRLAVRYDSRRGEGDPWSWPPEANVRADLSMEESRASRDVPAYTEVDRYDRETGVPRRAYLRTIQIAGTRMRQHWDGQTMVFTPID